MKTAYRMSAALALLALGAGPALAGFEAPETGTAEGYSAFNTRAWDLAVRAYVGTDSNVNLRADGDPFFVGATDSSEAGLIIDGVYHFLNIAGWDLGGGMKLEKVWYPQEKNNALIPGPTDNANEYNLTAYTPSLFANRKFTAFDKPASVSIIYAYRDEDATLTGVGASQHTWTFKAGIMPQKGVSLGFDASRTWSNFDVQFPNMALDDRSGEYDRFGVTGTWWFGGPRRNVSLGVHWIENDAGGANFDYDGWEGSISFLSHIYKRLWAQASLTHASQDYDGFVSPFIPAPGRTEQTVDQYGLQLFYRVSPQVTADAYWNATNIDSDDPIFDGSKRKIGVGLTYTP